MTRIGSRKLKIAVSLLTAVVILGFVVPTGAVSGEDQVWEEGDLVISPSDGPNGEYTEVTDGELSVELPNVNLDGTTRVAEVFNATNQGSAEMRVWITHDSPDVVAFERADGTSIQGEANNVTLSPGETVRVGLTVEAGAGLSAGDTVLDEFTVHAESDELGDSTTTTTAEPAPTGGTGGAVGGGGGGGIAAPTAPSTPTPSEPVAADGVEVQFVETTMEGSITVREVTMAELEQHPLERENPAPRAAIDPMAGAATTGADGDLPAVGTNGPDAVVQVDQEAVLTGSHSLLGSMRSLSPSPRLLRAVEVTPPRGMEDEPAIIRIRVDESRLGGTDPADASVARRTPEGWQLLPTTVVERGTDSVVFEARTPGFSVFAVFASNSVEYAWEVDGEAVSADQLSRTWESPGMKNVTLTVRDAMGRTDTVTHRVLVNDQPSVTVEAPDDITAGETTTLHANVTDEYGNATVTWTFPDGSQRTGETVEHTFEAGSRTVVVTAEDGYGGRGSAEVTFEVLPGGPTDPLYDRLPGRLPGGLGLAAIVLLGLAVLALGRRHGDVVPIGAVGRIGLPGLVSAASPPSIAAFEDPTVDLANRWFRIGYLRIEDPDGDLDTVELAVLDGRGDEVAHKTMDVRGRSEYVARNEVLLPKSPGAIRAGEEYTVVARAGDRGDRWADLARSGIRSGAGAPVPA